MKNPPALPQLTPPELRDLRQAKTLLENPGLTARLAAIIGTPIEKGFALLPKNWSVVVHRTTRTALLRALEVGVATLRPGRRQSSERMHKILAGASGGIGGAFGLIALPIELPISTTIMLRSIADIAQSEGHDIRELETRLSCLEVFALGGEKKSDNAAESAYWAVRAGLAQSFAEAMAYLTRKKVVEESAPAIMRLISAIASRFGVVVSEQVAAKAVPVIGAAGGSLVNVLFLNHFQDMARGHFIVKRLEKKYGTDFIRQLYQNS